MSTHTYTPINSQLLNHPTAHKTHYWSACCCSECKGQKLMGREGGSNPTAAHSSIALLQERFRQLQRVKEMREERELLRACSEQERPSPGGYGQRPRWFLHPDLVHPSRPLHAPKGFRPDSGSAEHAEFPVCSTSHSMGLWNGRSSIRSSYGSDEMDVDTSLHL